MGIVNLQWEYNITYNNTLKHFKHSTMLCPSTTYVTMDKVHIKLTSKTHKLYDIFDNNPLEKRTNTSSTEDCVLTGFEMLVVRTE